MIDLRLNDFLLPFGALIGWESHPSLIPKIGLNFPMDGVLDGVLGGVYGITKTAINTPIRTKNE